MSVWGLLRLNPVSLAYAKSCLAVASIGVFSPVVYTHHSLVPRHFPKGVWARDYTHHWLSA